MPTIRVRDWTKARLDEIRERQNHSSHDSVIKTLLKDHELAELRQQTVSTPESDSGEGYQPADDTEYAVPGMTVLAELNTPKDDVGFLWCPNCNTEVAHFTFSKPSSFEDFETTCPQCFTGLDQHVLVAIEIDYPLERKLVEDELAGDLKTAVIDYWDRRLEATPEHVEDGDDEELVNRLVWKFDQYAKEFMWEWPADVPVVGMEAGGVYSRTDGEERIEVLERVPNSGTTVDGFRVKRSQGGATESEEPELLDSETVCKWLRNRELQRLE